MSTRHAGKLIHFSECKLLLRPCAFWVAMWNQLLAQVRKELINCSSVLTLHTVCISIKFSYVRYWHQLLHVLSVRRVNILKVVHFCSFSAVLKLVLEFGVVGRKWIVLKNYKHPWNALLWPGLLIATLLRLTVSVNSLTLPGFTAYTWVCTPVINVSLTTQPYKTHSFTEQHLNCQYQIHWVRLAGP